MSCVLFQSLIAAAFETISQPHVDSDNDYLPKTGKEVDTTHTIIMLHHHFRDVFTYLQCTYNILDHELSKAVVFH